MKIYSATLNIHDHNTYDGVYHNQRERHTRFKHNVPIFYDGYSSTDYNLRDHSFINSFYNEYFKNLYDVLAFTMTKTVLNFNIKINDILKIKDFKPKNLWDYYFQNNLYYIDHHQSHATYAFINSGFEESDILAIDNIGWNFRAIFVKYSL